MLLEWIRRRDADFERFLKTYLFTEAPFCRKKKPQLPKQSDGAGRRGTEAVARPALPSAPCGTNSRWITSTAVTSSGCNLAQNRQGCRRGSSEN
jgi:hypothetical protein